MKRLLDIFAKGVVIVFVTAVVCGIITIIVLSIIENLWFIAYTVGFMIVMWSVVRVTSNIEKNDEIST